jgi:hypothetical protein
MPKLFSFLIFAAISSAAPAQNWNRYFADTSLFGIDTATVAGKKYIGFFNDGIYYLLNAKGDTLLKKQDYYINGEFKDFNQDGYKDVILHYSSNAPLVLDLFLYVPALKKFKEVQDFRKFPAPRRITGTKYYYSYHKSGCADLNWDSDLFYIENFKAIRIGNISGNGCHKAGDKKGGIFISKVQSSKKMLVKTFPIETIGNYKDYKWGFIYEYWTKNYKFFIG